MDLETLQNYLLTVTKQIKDGAFEAKNKSEDISKNQDFELGKRLAYYEVLTTLKNQAIIFGIPFKTINLDDIDIDKDIA